MQLYRGQRVLPWTPPFIINQSSSELTHTKILEGHCIVLLVPIRRIGCPGAENGEEERPSEAGKPRAVRFVRPPGLAASRGTALFQHQLLISRAEPQLRVVVWRLLTPASGEQSGAFWQSKAFPWLPSALVKSGGSWGLPCRSQFEEKR